MPELPEVETTVRGIAPSIERGVIKKVTVRCYQLRWPIPANLENLIQDQKVLQVRRRAKYILITFETGTLIIHLGMSGRLRILTNNIAPQKHDHVDFNFNSNIILRYTDPRRFGAILWTEDIPEQHVLLKNLGVEPLTAEFSSKYLAAKMIGRKVAVKIAIMDSKVVVGVGNIYAAEALFLAGIQPQKPFNLLKNTQINRLVSAIKHILSQAITQGGTTLKDFYNTDGKPGYFVQKLNVYGRAGQACVQCGHSLELMILGQRSTVFCPMCQR